MDWARCAMGLGLAATLVLTSGCGNRANREGSGLVSGSQAASDIRTADEEQGRGTIWDLFRSRGDQGQVGAVNKYIWFAALETLDFLPVQSSDPFTGVITTGYGTPPGGGRAYRATIYVSDPALDARSLNVALMTRSGPASASTVRAVEDAILTRARQLRQQDSRL